MQCQCGQCAVSVRSVCSVSVVSVQCQCGQCAVSLWSVRSVSVVSAHFTAVLRVGNDALMHALYHSLYYWLYYWLYYLLHVLQIGALSLTLVCCRSAHWVAVLHSQIFIKERTVRLCKR